jgi:hypothetical protein
MSNITTLGVVVLAAAISAGGCGVQKRWDNGLYNQPSLFARSMSPALTRAQFTTKQFGPGSEAVFECPGLPSGTYFVSVQFSSAVRPATRELTINADWLDREGELVASATSSPMLFESTEAG